MLLDKQLIAENNAKEIAEHKSNFDFVSAKVTNLQAVLDKLVAFQIAIPSWALIIALN